jgi:hypothetical protein
LKLVRTWRVILGVLVLATVSTFQAVLSFFPESTVSFPAWGRWAGLGGTFALTAGVALFEVYRPLLEATRETQQAWCSVLLASVVRDYRDAQKGTYDLRGNIMVLRGPPWRRRLCFLVSTEGYPKAELEQEFQPGVGCAGTAVEAGGITFFDPAVAPEHFHGMTETQKTITKHIGSILSVPVYKGGKPNGRILGVLNLDSSGALGTTAFNKPDLQALTSKYAGLAGAILG